MQSRIFSSKKHKKQLPQSIMRLSSLIKVEYVFLALSLVFGLMYVFFIPPVAVVDEENHYFRALEVADGNIYTDRLNNEGQYGAYLPDNLVQYVYYNKGLAMNLPSPSPSIVDALGDQRPDQSKLHAAVYNGSAVYSPMGYLPQAVGIAIAKAANLSNEGYILLGRIVNLFVFIALTFIAIKLIPLGKTIIFAVALLPMSMYQAASLSADAMVMASTFLLFSLTVLLITRKAMPSKKLVIAVIALASVVALVKTVYLILIIPVLIYWVFTVKKAEKVRAGLIVGAVAVVPAALFLLWSSRLSDDVTVAAAVLESGSKIVSPAEQLRYIISHPFAYIGSIIDLFFFDYVRSEVALKGLIGRFGWNGGPYFASASLMILSIFNIFIATLIDRQKRIMSGTFNNDTKRKMYSALFALSSIVAVLGIVTTLYLAFTSVGAKPIEGVQGRYFIPVLLTGMFAFVLLKPQIIKKIDPTKAQYILYGLVSVNLVYTALTITRLYQ